MAYAPPLRWTTAALIVLSLTGLTAVEGASAAPAPPASTSSHKPNLNAAPEVIATDIQMPWGLAILPGGDALITERQTSRILRIRQGHAPEPIRTIPDVYIPGGDGGLLGLDISPRFAQDNLVYVFFTAVGGESRIARFKLDSDEPLEVILAFTRGESHSGGRLKFGPDGMLYATVGDGHLSGSSQDLTNLNGKILRITPDGRPAPGNPFPNSPVWTYGHRNLEGLAWDAQGRMYASEFGEDAVDEINLIRPGRNYGWPMVEGFGDTDNGRLTNPLITFPTADASPAGIAISGNTLYMAALRGERLWTMPLVKGRIGQPTEHFQGVYGRLRTVEIAPDGALWLTTSNHPRQPREGDDRILRFPAR
ncbi:PQQ-dependent sugar dehydrogenase [Kibdelosporangium aridum]|uniref:Glucose/arabinose dehydrogenase, beta-propeller fold n=1 Tax=Kibdelosporangium aridum TaxID=2030 RepID=A0A1Y5Y3L8_KIBAR|nr:PQQ-dependent sugar dehydrogenase [Kibdelosporangium aridum]SMD22788.1 Glucose/arabinose dehydrogenase, beta-propeller fold [Kibdelosporangium aridum]